MAGLRRLRQPHERPGAGRFRNALLSISRIAAGFALLARARLTNRIFIVTIMDPLPFALAMLLLLRLSGARIIFIVHDPLPHAWHLPPSLRGVERALWHGGHRLSHALVVLSEPSRMALMRELPDYPGPVTVIDHGIFGVDEVAPLPRAGVMLLFGTLRSNKGIMEAIEGVRRARALMAHPLRLLIRGGGHRDEAEYLAQVRRAAADAGDAVDLDVGYVSEEALPGLIAGCDALLMPYKDFHSQSGVAMVAAGYGRPIIASAAGGLATLMEEGMPCSPIAQPVTGEGVAQAVLSFFRQPYEEWEDRALRYREHMLDRYGWKRIGARFAELAGRF